MKSFRLEIVGPIGKKFDKTVEKVFLRTEGGDMAIMAGHAPLLAVIKPCELRTLFLDGKDESFMLDDGFLAVFNNKVTIMSNKL